MDLDPNSPQQEQSTPQAPEETPESSSTEAPQQEAASPEDPGAESPDGEDGEESQPGAAGKEGERKKRNGHQRSLDKIQRQNDIIEKLAQQNAQLMEMFQRGQHQQPGGAPDKQLTPEEKAAAEVEEFVNQRVQRALAQEKAQLQEQQAYADLQKQMAEARAKHEDFDESIRTAPRVPPHVEHAILKSVNKAEIMYALSENQAELARKLRALPPLDAALEIGRLDAKLTSGAGQQAATSPNRRPSAPAPISPVSARSTSTVKRTEDMSYDEFKAWRKQGGGR